MIWVGRYPSSPSVRVIYPSTEQKRLPRGHVRLRLLHLDSEKLGEEIVEPASVVRRMVRTEKDQSLADECVLKYLRLKNCSPSLTVQTPLPI